MIAMTHPADSLSPPINSSMDNEVMRRLEAKPWYMRNTKFGGTTNSGGGITIPLSPVTLVIGILSLWNLWKIFHCKKTSWAEASHILMDGNDAKHKLQDMKDHQIQNSATQFARCARQYSICSSNVKGGYLGRFEQGVMVPPFDRAVFDSETTTTTTTYHPLETTIGPIETHFGWHLIYIHKRQMHK